MEKLLLAFLWTESRTRAMPQDGIGTAALLGYFGILPQKSWFVGQSVHENADDVAHICIS